MLSLLIRRLAQMVFVMLGISILVFLIFFATPGADPASRIAGRNASPEVVAAVRASFGLDKPLPVQYALMMKRLFIDRNLTSFVNRGQEVIRSDGGTPITRSIFGQPSSDRAVSRSASLPRRPRTVPLTGA
jgi:peptide/nickel transport system permease protein